jgi:ribosomal protein S18 acetylase RimI-like enzyme
MDSPLTIRRGRAGDAAGIAQFNAAMAIETEGLKLPPEIVGPGVAAALADENKAIYFVAEQGGRVLGQLMITHEWSDWRNGDIWWIQSVYVHPEARRRGLFRRLYEHARNAAKEAGAVGLRLYVEHNNSGAQAVYRQLGMSLTHYQVMEEIWSR